MKRSVPGISFLFAVVVLGLFLLLDPLAWFGGEREAEAFPPSTATPETPAASDEPELEGIPEVPVADRPGESERSVVEPSIAAGLASFRILDPAEHPVAGAHVVLVRDESVLLDERTDERGTVEAPADARPALLVVLNAPRPPESREVVLDPGRQEIRLSEGETIGGRLVREDGEPAGAMAVRLHGDHPLPFAAGIPEVAWEALGIHESIRSVLSGETDDAGGFAFPGLPPSWSGAFRPPYGWRVVATSDGQVGAAGYSVRLSRPVSDLLVRIAPTLVLHGRLVLRDDGAPLAGASLSAMLRSPDVESPQFTGTRTDEGGGFAIVRRYDRVSSFDLRLGGAFHESPTILLLDGSDIPADGDLGDVVVDEVRNVPFLLQDTKGAPIAGGRAVAAGTRSEPTGEDGRSELRWLPRSVARMTVDASGYVPADVELPVVVVDPLVVTLESANRLDVTLLLPEGGDPTQFRVVLRGDERITATPIPEGGDQHPYVGEWAFPPIDLTSEAQDRFLCARPDEQHGVALFRALRPGVVIELEVRGITGRAVYHRETLSPFAPAEVRELEVDLRGAILVFRGRVLDLEGNPLVQASLQLGNQILGWTDEEGAFLCFLADPEPGTLLVGHRACATEYLHDYVIPSDGRPVEFRLSPARRVTIEVVDENGDPVPQAEIWVRHGGFHTNTHRVEGNRHVASSVPDAPFELVATLAGREYVQEHDPANPEATIVVPVHGRLTAVIAARTLASRQGRFLLILRPTDDESARTVVESRDSAPGLRIEIAAAHPGTYEASLVYDPSEEEEAGGRARESSDPAPVTVEAGREVEIRLELPDPR